MAEDSIGKIYEYPPMLAKESEFEEIMDSFVDLGVLHVVSDAADG